MKKKVLIFGAAGYIGSILCKFLLHKNFEIIAIDNLIYNNFFSIKDLQKKKNFTFLNNKEKKIKKIQNLILSSNYVVYLAGLVGDPITKKYPKVSKYHNFSYISQILKLLKKNKDLRKFIFISTCSNYGLIKKNILAKESHKLKPLSLYAKQKVNC